MTIRLVFAATTVLAAMHVLRTRGSGSTAAAPQMSVHPAV